MTKLYDILKSHGVTLYAVAKAGGWSWQQVASWVKGSRTMQIKTFIELQQVLTDNFGIEIEITDLEKSENYEQGL
ncbi:MAG: helix-turn-helix transcriptional regulator [Bacteroidales bacterium]|nr:helix-turn-helix transcriptional regulator [Bacteroidales bacterium]